MPLLEEGLSRMSKSDRQALAHMVALFRAHPEILGGAADEGPDDLLEMLRKLFDLLRKERGRGT